METCPSTGTLIFAVLLADRLSSHHDHDSQKAVERALESRGRRVEGPYCLGPVGCLNARVTYPSLSKHSNDRLGPDDGHEKLALARLS